MSLAVKKACSFVHLARWLQKAFAHRAHIINSIEDRRHFGVEHLLHLRFEKAVALARYLNAVSGKKFLH